MKLIKSGPVLTTDQIDEFSRDFEFNVPESVRRFYQNFNGGIPDHGFFPANEFYDFIEVSKFLSFLGNSSDVNGIERAFRIGREKGFISDDLMPIAIDWGGNYICVSQNGVVYYVVNDTFDESLSMEENMKNNTRKICIDFDDFINSLVPEDEAY